MNIDSRTRGTAQATVAMLSVGALVAVSALLVDYPVYGGQAVRYAVAAIILVAVLAARRSVPVRLSARDIALLTALAATGLAAFNVGIVEANNHASPAFVGTVIGSAPIMLAVLGPLVARTGRPAPRVLVAAVVVVGGTAVATGFGHAEPAGLGFALMALAGEVCFSLLAVPLLPKLGPLRVSAYSAALSVPLLLAAGAVADGAQLLAVPTATELLGLAYLAVIVTAVAFLLWYDALSLLGPDRAGLFAGLMPVGAVLTMLLLGLGVPTAAEWIGVGLVVCGITIGLRRPATTTRTRRSASPEPPRQLTAVDRH